MNGDLYVEYCTNSFSFLLYIPIVMMDLLARTCCRLVSHQGSLAFHGQGDTKFVFQGVHEQINFGPSQTPWGKDEERVNKFVFIGKGLGSCRTYQGTHGVSLQGK